MVHATRLNGFRNAPRWTASWKRREMPAPPFPVASRRHSRRCVVVRIELLDLPPLLRRDSEEAGHRKTLGLADKRAEVVCAARLGGAHFVRSTPPCAQPDSLSELLLEKTPRRQREGKPPRDAEKLRRGLTSRSRALRAPTRKALLFLLPAARAHMRAAARRRPSISMDLGISYGYV